jgi:Barstar (barnase inhibitor)
VTEGCGEADKLCCPPEAAFSSRAFLDTCAGMAAFPAHFGRNWDAWIDVMSDRPADRPVLLEITLPASGADPDSELLRQLVECSAEVNRRLGGPVLRLAFR